MFTLEQKINIVLEYITTTDNKRLMDLMDMAKEALKSVDPVQTTLDAEDIIAFLLKEVGMPPHLKGYRYTVTAIKLCMSDPEYLDDITHRLYPDIASQHKTIGTRVERAIRHAVEAVFDRGDMESIADVFGNTISANKGKLTNGEFIAHCAGEVSRRMKYLDLSAHYTEVTL